nr:protein TORNADO 1 [Tanacetum cinerariifolium]
MIEANLTLKSLTLFDSSSVIASLLISAVLARNRSTEVHVWSGGSDNEDNSKIVEFISQCSMLRIYRINVSGVGQGFLILDFEWFFGEVVGQLVKLNVKKVSVNDGVNGGFVSRKELEKILRGNLQSQIPRMGPKVFENLNVTDLLNIMLKLKLCYKKDPSDHGSLLLIPLLLEDSRTRTPRWQLINSDSEFVGRHLEFHDSGPIFLTPGFFPRLQVHLHSKIIGLVTQHGATYTLEKSLISIIIHGVHIRIELGGYLGYHLDILACSSKNIFDTLKLFWDLIYPSIQSLCQGVMLTENIIRLQCVKNLNPPRYPKTHIVPLAQLKHALLSVSAEEIYDYQHTWTPVSDSGHPVLNAGFDFARDLLSDDDLKEVLNGRYHDLYNPALELQVPLENATVQENETNIVDPSLTEFAKGVEEVIQRLKIIENEIRDLKHEIQGLRYYEPRLLTELHHKVNYLTNYNVQIEERKVPNMFYFVKTKNYSRRLVTNIFFGMTALWLHMLCEFRGEMHVVDDQMGCKMMQIDNQAVTSLAPYMGGFMKLLTFALKIGAHVAARMGNLIPDLSKAVASLTDNPLVYGAAGVGVVGAVAAARQSRGRLRDVQQDMKAAQQWIVDFLREKGCSSGKDITETFGLWRVRYRDGDQMTTSSANNSVFRGFFKKPKLTGPNFIDWYRQLRIVLSIKDKLNYLEQPIPPAPVAPAGVKDSVCPASRAGASSDYERFSLLQAGRRAGLRASRKLKPGAISLYVGNGQREAVEEIDAFIYKRIEKLQHDGLLDSYDLKAFEKCVSCMSGKMARKPYTHQVERAKDLLRLIHTDVCGPFKIMSRQGASYFITFTDDFNHYGYVYLLKHKHEVFETFKLFQKEVENQLGKTIKSLRFDCGVDNMSQEFLDHLKDHGIIAHHTPPYTPRHNGVSEWRNRTILDMVQSMMSQTTLSKSFWDYALETAASILNMAPTKKVEKTPYEVWHGKAPKLSYLKVLAYASGSLEDLEIIQEEDMHPSIDTSLYHEKDDLKINEPQSDIVPIHRSIRTRHAPDCMCLYIDIKEHELGDLGEPANYKAALLDPESEKWLNAMNVEMQSMKDNEVWVLIELPPNRKTVGSKWLFKKKTDMDGNVHTYKAHLVAKGYTQTLWIDYEETFSPVADIRAIRILIAIAAYYDYEI